MHLALQDGKELAWALAVQKTGLGRHKVREQPMHGVSIKPVRIETAS